MARFLPRGYAALPLVFFLALSCRGEAPAQFFKSASGTRLYGGSGPAAAGNLRFTVKGAALAYRFDPPLEIPAESSLELEYEFDPGGGPASAFQAVLAWSPAGGNRRNDSNAAAAWDIPLQGASQDGPSRRTLRYAVPLPPGRLGGFTLSGAAGRGTPKDASLKIRGLRVVPRWFGVRTAPGGASLTPFVYRNAGGNFVVDPAAPHRFSAPPALLLEEFAGQAEFTSGGIRYEYFPGGGSDQKTASLLLPAPLLRLDSPGSWPVTAAFSSWPGAVILSVMEEPGLPAGGVDPIPLDPGLVPVWPRESWRDGRFEIFRWDEFPEILIFHTADYEIQARLFKRLAFFVEKAGYRGSLASDAELAPLHGWNAHDYSDAALAAFFEAARRDNFPLLPEEEELRELLFRYGLLRRDPTGYILPAKTGVVLSISSQSPLPQRQRFLVHEAFHGLFFLDGGFRAFAIQRYENLDEETRLFFRAWLDHQKYDSRDHFLVINEFMAHCLQQTAGQAGAYFGETIARQIGRRAGPRVAEAFTREAGAFSDYVSQRWGFAAGRAGRFRVTED